MSICKFSKSVVEQNHKVVLHRDNAFTCSANVMTVKVSNVKGLHPPYSPDLAPTDCIYFRKSERNAYGPEAAMDGLRDVIDTVSEKN
ncbi:hypothetical protein EVAR_82215_1 [Eumeta japonica]|uniref:Mariner Mos1 transposase n=1 Tax=Eumeta variegata TaxID=151549 RepID=A0A4C1W3V7_EUMVA|nr:hypothetical protein EVAR_82215_1 [Eumeta japonica]